MRCRTFSRSRPNQLIESDILFHPGSRKFKNMYVTFQQIYQSSITQCVIFSSIVSKSMNLCWRICNSAKFWNVWKIDAHIQTLILPTSSYFFSLHPAVLLSTSSDSLWRNEIACKQAITITGRITHERLIYILRPRLEQSRLAIPKMFLPDLATILFVSFG